LVGRSDDQTADATKSGSEPPAGTVSRRAIGGLAVGLAAGWNIANTGAAASTLHTAYGVSLATVGLLTTSLLATHFGAQIPGGAMIDRFGARAVAVAALAVIAGGNAVALATASFPLAILARLLIGLGSGSGFIAGSDWVRGAGASAAGQGLYGGASVGGAGLAIGIVPLLTPWLDWRAAYASALVVAAACSLPVLVPVALKRAPKADTASATTALRTRSLWPLAALHTASFGLSVIAGNWIVTLLRHDGLSRTAAAAIGALTLLGGLATRPLAGAAIRRSPPSAKGLLTASVVCGSAGMALLALPVHAAALAFAAGAVGLAAGVPFAPAFTGAQRLVPHAPAAAVGVVNSAATFAILAATPLVGLTFALPSHGRIGFGVLAAAWLSALLAVPAAARALTIGEDAAKVSGPLV
jgi:MFS family permease